ncbi:hypothetical protein E0K89_012665 [Aquicoccus sp. SCR17]|nr:hypothetical protein [Carideicomes alvinocaridis]
MKVGDLVRYALQEHALFWWGEDGVDYYELQANGGKYSRESVRKVSARYGVSRGILRNGPLPREKTEKDCDLGAEGIANLVNQTILEWPTSTVERAEFVADLADQANEDGLTKGRQISAFSKLVWFVRPECWVLYDSYVVNACGINASDPRDRMTSYYAYLADNGFEDDCHAMRGILEKSRFFQSLWPERILDKALWIRGAKDTDAQWQGRSRAFRKALGQSIADELADVAEDLNKVVGNSKLLTG